MEMVKVTYQVSPALNMLMGLIFVGIVILIYKILSRRR